MLMEIFYEDLMENFNNQNLRDKLMNLVNKHKIIIVKGLSSSQRYMIYRQMYYPLKFEKVIVNENNEENINIKIYNYKIKNNKTNEKNENIEKGEKTKNKDEYILDDSVYSEEESLVDSESDCESEDSYFTEEDEQLSKLEDIGSQILERVVKNEKKIDRTKGRVNLVILFNIIGWIMLYALDPVRVIHIRSTECEIF